MISQRNLNRPLSEHERRAFEAVCELIKRFVFQDFCRRALGDPLILVCQVDQDTFHLLTSDGPAPQERVH